MGQRSQIYVSYKTSGGRELVARYFGWNYGSRMISRVKGLVEWLKVNRDYLDYEKRKIFRVAETNFDLRDIVESSDCLKEYEEQGIEPFTEQPNNDGKGFVLVTDEGKIKYCFTDGDLTAPLTAEQYMDWDDCLKDTEEEDGSNYSENCKYLSGFELMTDEELRTFIDFDYINLPAVKKGE